MRAGRADGAERRSFEGSPINRTAFRAMPRARSMFSRPSVAVAACFTCDSIHVIGRLGGDEFARCLCGLSSETRQRARAKAAALEQAVEWAAALRVSRGRTVGHGPAPPRVTISAHHALKPSKEPGKKPTAQLCAQGAKAA